MSHRLARLVLRCGVGVLLLAGGPAAAQTLELTIVDPTLECGAVSSDNPVCTGSAHAQVNVEGSVPWVLSIEDAGCSGNSQAGAAVTMCNTTVGRTGTFVIQLLFSSACTTQSGSTAGGNPTSPGLPCSVSIDASTLTGLTFTDEAGQYEGEFVVTLSAM